MKHIFGRALLIFTAFLILSLSLLSCTEIPDSTEEELTPVVKVGNTEVPFEIYRYFFMNYKSEYDRGDAAYWTSDETDAEATLASIKEKTLSAIHRAYAVFSLCEQYGIDPYGKEIENAVDDTVKELIKTDFGSKSAYVEALAEVYMTDSVFRFAMRSFECDEQLNRALIDAGVIKTDNETVTNAIHNPEVFCRAKQILIKNDEGESLADNLAEAKTALTAAGLGEDFDALVAKYGEDPEMIVNPTGYYFTHNELIEEFEDAAFALEIGEMSGVVTSHVGYHIILRCELDEEYVEENFAELRDSYLTWKFHEAVEAEMEKLTVTVTNESLTSSLEAFAK